MKTMKTSLIFAVITLVALFAFGQDKNLEQIDVSAPQYIGVQYVATVQNDFPNTMIKNYLKDNIEYPAESAGCLREGTEVVQFIVTAEGELQDFRIINSVCSKIDEEVIRTLKQTNGQWIPGTNNGKPVDMSKELSFTFVVNNYENKSIHEIFTRHATEYYNKGSRMLFVKNDVRKALKLYDKGMNYLPYDKCLLLSRGMCRFELGDKKGAAEDWNRLYELGGNDMTKFVAEMKNMKGYYELMAILNK